MSYPRQLLLYDQRSQPSSWNERMIPGEYAVHYSSFESSPAGGPYCTVFGSLGEAEAFARQQVAERPDLRCMIYDHQGLIGPPLKEIRGAKYKGSGDISPRFRRWVGSVFFFVGLGLILLDWSNDFRLSWPALIGVRMLIPGVILLVTEASILLYARIESRRGARSRTI
jgi:hypothetical protein